MESASSHPVAVPFYRLVSRGGIASLEIVRDHLSFVSHVRRIPEDLIAIQRECLQYNACLAVEIAGMAFLDQQNRVLGYCQVAEGDSTSVYVSTEAIVKRFSLRVGATGIILWHNHLGTNAEPSEADIKVFQRIRAELPPYIRLVDFCIGAGPALYSFQANGRFDKKGVRAA